MNKFIPLVLAASAAVGAAAPAMAQIGVSVGINQPGVYGRINIGVPAPALVLPDPVIVVPPPVAVQRSPIYLYVSPYEQQNWRRYCGRYNACGQPVYFVREDWVRERYGREHRDGTAGAAIRIATIATIGGMGTTTIVTTATTTGAEPWIGGV